MLSYPNRYKVSSWTQSKSLARKKAEGTWRGRKEGGEGEAVKSEREVSFGRKEGTDEHRQ